MSDEQTDEKIVADYRAWCAEHEALMAMDEDWTPEQYERQGELWSLIFEGKHDALEAALRITDRLKRNVPPPA